MPRLRRKAVERRSKPQLNARIVAWLDGAPADEATLWDVYILEHGKHDRADFWARVRAAIVGGELEISDEVEHTLFENQLEDYDYDNCR